MRKYTKIVISGDIVETYEYQYKPKNNTATRRSPRKRVKNSAINFRREDNVRRMCAKFKRLVWSNLSNGDAPAFLTLTLARDLSYETGRKLHNQFFKRLAKSGYSLRYISIPEFQLSGRLHFHVLVWGLSEDIVKNEKNTRFLANQWGYGFIDVFQTDNSPRLAGYLAKYLSKSLYDKRFYAKKAYTTSSNIVRSVSLNTSVQTSYLKEVIGYDYNELSTVPPLLSKTYDTKWLGQCYYNKYKLK